MSASVLSVNIWFCSVQFFCRIMPPKRAADNNREEKRQRVNDSLNVENNLQNTADPALTISPALIETLVSRVADEVTRRLQPRDTEPLPGTSSGEQPSSPKPAQEVADPQEKTNSLVEQTVFSVSQSLAGEQNHVTGRLFGSSCLPIVWKVQIKCESRYGQFLNVHTSEDHSLSWFHTRCLVYGLFHMSFHLLIHSSQRN